MTIQSGHVLASQAAASYQLAMEFLTTRYSPKRKTSGFKVENDTTDRQNETVGRLMFHHI